MHAVVAALVVRVRVHQHGQTLPVEHQPGDEVAERRDLERQLALGSSKSGRGASLRPGR
jgi:hypothetical protein